MRELDGWGPWPASVLPGPDVDVGNGMLGPSVDRQWRVVPLGVLTALPCLCFPFLFVCLCVSCTWMYECFVCGVGGGQGGCWKSSSIDLLSYSKSQANPELAHMASLDRQLVL